MKKHNLKIKRISKVSTALLLTVLTVSSSVSVVSADEIITDTETITNESTENDDKSDHSKAVESNTYEADSVSDEGTTHSDDTEGGNIKTNDAQVPASYDDEPADSEIIETTKSVSGVGETGRTKLQSDATQDTNNIEKENNNATQSAAFKENTQELKSEYPDGWNEADGKSLYYKDNKPYTGWVYEKGSYFFTLEGNKYTGWKYLGVKEGETKPHWSYFGNDGRLYTGWHYMSSKEGESTPHWSYFGDNGWLRTGWIQLGKGTSNPDGNAAKHWSYFGDNGWLRTGWIQLGKGTSNPDGNAAKHWSYFGDNGWLRTGWVQLGKGPSEPDGNAAKHWSYFGDNGWLRTGWVKLGKGTSEPDGNSTPHLSYFGDNGWLKTGTANISGMNCTFRDNGWLRLYETVTPHYNQHAYGYGTGCGAVSLYMAMRYKGYLSGWTLQRFMSTMPYTSDGNPNNGFVGSPYNYDLTPANRAIYPAALAKWGSRYGKVTDISGCTVDYMMTEVLKNNPVLVLATWNMSDYAITEYSWGKYRDYNHHFFVLVGYDYDHDRYKVMDTLLSTGDGSKWVTGASFRKVWNGIKGSVVVR